MSKKFLFISALLLIFSSLFLSHLVLAGDEIEIIGPEIHAGVTGKRYCGNNITSCGEPGKCVDLTGMVYCVRGRVVETRCLSNNIRNETLTTPCDGGSFEVNFVDVSGNDASVDITTYEKDSSDIIGKSSVTGKGHINALELSADMNVEFLNSEFVFLIKGADFTNFVGKTSDFVIDKVNAVVPGTTVFKAFYVELPSNFTFSAVVLKIKYSDISEENIVLYKCSDFDSSSGTCNGDWEIVAMIKDSTNKIVIAEVNSFSAYTLGDDGGTEPTTTTTSTTTTSTTTTTTITIPSSSTSSSSSSSSSSGNTPPSLQPCELNGVCDSWETHELCPSDCPEGGETTTTTTPTGTTQPDSTTTTGSETSEEQENEATEDKDKTTGFFPIVGNYMQVVLPLAGMAGALIFNFMRKPEREYSRIIYRSARPRRTARYQRKPRYSTHSKKYSAKKSSKESKVVLNV